MGTNDWSGYEFLKKNVIEGCSCDLEKEFAFISYAHDEIDTRIVRNVFKRLYDMGWNLWIDTANIPRNGEAWNKAALKALTVVKNCKMALFFRSEESMVREPIKEELDIIKTMEEDHIRRTLVIDIFHEDIDAKTCRKNVLLSGNEEKINTCQEICKIISLESSAIRLRTDAENDINKLVEEINKELELENIYKRNATENPTFTQVSEPVVVPEQKPVQKGGLWHYTNSKGADAFLVWEDEHTKKCVVQKGSRVAAEAFSFASSVPAANKLKQELIQKGILVADVFQEDYPYDKVSTMINLIGGGSINMRDQIKKGLFTPIN